jgi:hypothetical protein
VSEVPDPTKIGRGTEFDRTIVAETLKLISDHGLSVDDVLDNHMLFLRRVNFARYIAHFEIFRMILDVPGAIVECGVFKGQSLLTFAKLVDVLCPGDTIKRVIGFDTFTGFLDLAEADGRADAARGKVVGGWSAGDHLSVLEGAIDLTRRDSMIPRFKRIELVRGDVRETIPRYVREQPGMRIALLHLDLDLYEPTKVALEYLYPLVAAGGVVILDEYGMPGFPGESAAFDEFFGDSRPKLRKFPYISTPGGFFVKPG